VSCCWEHTRHSRWGDRWYTGWGTRWCHEEIVWKKSHEKRAFNGERPPTHTCTHVCWRGATQRDESKSKSKSKRASESVRERNEGREMKGELDTAHTWTVAHVVDPPSRLLHTNLSPLWFRHQKVFLQSPRNRLGQYHVSATQKTRSTQGTTIISDCEVQ
jgi:hypothetical protein